MSPNPQERSSEPSESGGSGDEGFEPGDGGIDTDANADTDIGDLPEDGPPTIDEGRYIYCLVSVPDDETADFETTGVEGEPVSLVTVDGIGAVVHECDDIYDSADISRIRRWLVRHQSVVDDAGQTFGTPLPFQFDTILRGDDDDVREWIRGEFETLEPILDSLADHWEYRVEVVRTEPLDDATLAELDDELADLREKIDDADEGTGFLLEKQYERRAKEVRSNERALLAADLRERLSEHAREVHELERTPAATLDDGTGGDDDADRETLCRLTLLAHEDEEGAIGSVLDDVAAEPGIEVRFTGPWPPYTFAPEIGDGDGGGGGGGSDSDGNGNGDTDATVGGPRGGNGDGDGDGNRGDRDRDEPASNPHSTHDR